MPLRRVTPPVFSGREVVVCLPDRVEQARISAALPRGDVARICHSASELAALVVDAAESLRLVVAAPRDGGGRALAPIIRDLVQRRPDVAVVAYCRADPESSRDIIDLVNAGIHDLVFRDRTDWGQVLRRTLESASENCGAAFAITRVCKSLPAELHPLAEYCLYFPSQATSVPRVAAALGVHRKTLANYCMRANLPGAGAVIMWCRLVTVAYLLESRRTTVERIAFQLEFASATALRNTLRRYTGLRPGELRDGGFLRLIDAFVAWLNARDRRAA